MPNRILKESICTSDSIDALDWFGEVLFYRLLVNCDDYGRFDGRTAVIKNRLFPLKTEGLTLKNVEVAINKLVSIGLVCRYEANGKPFLFLPTWNEHQQIRAKKSKFPEPEIICNHLLSSDSKCPRNPIQSESNPNTNTKGNAHARVTPGESISFDGMCPELEAAVKGWLEYKAERKEPYGEQGLKALIGEIHLNAGRFGAEAVAGIIRASMSNGYKGIVFDRLGKSSRLISAAEYKTPHTDAGDINKLLKGLEKL